MPGGSNPSNRLSSQSADKQKQVKTVQSLLTAKKDKDISKQPTKRTRSDVSTDSNTSMDLSGIINFQKDLDEIKFSLKDVTTKDDLNEVTKDLVKTADLENMVTGIVKKLFSKFESTLDKKMNERLNKIQTEMQEKVEALSIENEHLRRKIDQNEAKTISIKKNCLKQQKLLKKNNIKVFNFPWKEQQDLRQDFIQMVKSDLNITLHDRDIVAIHRLPAQREPRPLIVRCFNTDVKRSIMRKRKELRNKVKFVDDVTTRNMALIKRLEDSGRFDQVWYFNCGIYGRTDNGLQMKYGLYDDINRRLREGKDLSRNYIETLPEDLFVHNLQLAQLILNGNKIKSFDSNMLTKNTALYILMISDNPIISLNLKGNISTLIKLSCLNCFDCACMDSSTWSWIKQKYDNVDFSCRDGKAINSNLIAVDCLNNSHVTLYSKDTKKVGLACQCFDVTSSRTEVNISLTEKTENQLYEQAVTLQTHSIDNDNVQNYFTTDTTRTANTKSNDQISSPLEGSSLAILSGIVGFILGSFTTVAILLLVKRKHNEKVHQERILRHKETNTLVLDSINIIQSLDIEDIEVYGETLGHFSLNIPPRNHTEGRYGNIEVYGETLSHISLNIPPRNHTEDIEVYGETLSHISLNIPPRNHTEDIEVYVETLSLNIPPRNHEILLTEEGKDCFTLCSTVEQI
ncbi:unnamed protein product [Mytilus edulis]|uniref:Uncharacterized protein n=1 Tax=Mytilus edulis TaxID=6550 RepID=A0A8S3V033_MYTED|nr:unnamed protein product [Mytilus edulis]